MVATLESKFSFSLILKRLLAHFTWLPARVLRCFPNSEMERISTAIKSSEESHSGEIVFVVEGALPFRYIFKSSTPRQRAVDLFSEHRVWDTAHNSGVLIYLLLSERDIEIVADRGVASAISDEDFKKLVSIIELQSKRGAMVDGVIETIGALSDRLSQVAPKGTGDINEIRNRPILL